MSRQYHMRQAEIAGRLGVTQAAVSKYLSSRRGAKVPEGDVTRFIEASISGDRKTATDIMCGACQASRRFDCAFMLKK